MSNLPTITRLYADDFGETPTWFRNEFIKSFNQFSQPVYDILNEGIDVTQNTTEEFYSFALTATGVSTTDIFNFVPKKFIGKPHGVILCQCIANTPTVTPIGSPVTFDWVFGSGGAVNIIAIYGLTAGVQYIFTVRVC